MVIIRFWVEQLFKCAFKYVYLKYAIFNPETINLLFENDKTIVKKIHIRSLHLLTSKDTFLDFLKFALNSSAIYQSLFFVNRRGNISEQQTDIFFNIMINVGNKLHNVSFAICNNSRLYDRIIEVRFIDPIPKDTANINNHQKLMKKLTISMM